MDEDEIVKSVIETLFKIPEPSFQVNGDEYNRRILFQGSSVEGSETRKGQLLLHTSLSTCPVCTKRLGNYYEAILQLRGGKGERLDSLLDYGLDLIKRAPSRNVFLTRMERIKEGYDLFISDKQYARSLSRRLIERYGGTLKETSHLVGMKKGNELYRVTISVRIPDFQKGDVISSNGSLFLVEGVKGDVATLLDIESDSLSKSKLPDLEDCTIFRNGEDIRDADVLYRENNTAYILDPFDLREKAVVDRGQTSKVKIVKVGEEIFVVPTR